MTPRTQPFSIIQLGSMPNPVCPACRSAGKQQQSSQRWRATGRCSLCLQGLCVPWYLPKHQLGPLRNEASSMQDPTNSLSLPANGLRVKARRMRFRLKAQHRKAALGTENASLSVSACDAIPLETAASSHKQPLVVARPCFLGAPFVPDTPVCS